MGGRRNSSAAKKRTRDPFPLAAVLGLVRAAGALWRALLRWDPEIVGIVALGLALLLGIALAAPAHSGALGRWTHGRLDALFGAGAPLFAILVGLLAAIVFVERDVPRAIAALGGSACGYFAIVEAALALWHHRGGAAGATLGAMLRGALGDAGAWVVLLIALLAITVGVTGISLKEAASHSQRPLAVLRERAAAWRPTRLPALAGATFAPPAPVRFYDEPLGVDPDDDADEDDDDGDDDDEYEEDADSDEDADIDEDGDDDEDDDADDAALTRAEPADHAVDGEYEPRPPRIAYRLPDVAQIFDPPAQQRSDDASRAHVLEDTLASFGVGAKVMHIERGPSITRYELRPERGVKISRISALADDLALALAATSVRIEAPIPGKSAVGIEIPNASVSLVAIREILEQIPRSGPPLWVALGKDITGRPVFGDLAKMPHLLVAGATGSGKSVCLNAIIASLLVTATPDQLELLMIDPKRVELTVYNGIPHLKNAVITDPRLAGGALAEITREMDARYERFARAGVRKIEEYNAKYSDEKLPYVVVVIDELADLMLIAPAKVEMLIMRLAQLARATGIHLVVATQRPSVDVITGLIKANIPSRIAFAVSSQVDSRTILDMGGAERLLGRGDMLYLPIDAPKPIRAQGALVTGSELERLVAFWLRQAKAGDTKAMEIVPLRDDDERGGERRIDELWYDAARFLLDARIARGDAAVGSTAALQARFAIGHPRAVRLMRQLEELAVVGPNEGTKPRVVTLESPAELERIAERIGRPPAQPELFAE